MRSSVIIRALCSLLFIGLTAASLLAVLADGPSSSAGNSLTAEQKAALAAVDVRLAATEALAEKIDDADYKSEVGRQIDDLKKSRGQLEKDFDQGKYEALMHSVISRYQVIALWLKSPPPKPGQ